jgi:hemolysin III
MTLPIADDAAATAVRPTWRGRIHRCAAIVAVPLFVGLAVAADPGNPRLACVIYGLAVTTMLAVSATYHAAGTSPAAKRRLRRVDHSTILLAIAGSYTAIGSLALRGDSERRLLTFVWVAGLIGIAIRMTWMHAPSPLVAVVYLVVGWSAVLELNPLLAALDTLETTLLVAGGLLYTAGAIVYSRRRPDPRPAVFGYHEVFHALVAAAASAHYALVALLLSHST